NISRILSTASINPIASAGNPMLDRILDMFRTSVNVFSDSCGAVLIAKTEGEQDVLKAKPVGAVS
ncbi:MAG: dicarboxylate/amino acid:cation symporter, partial [Pseudomonadota bacterium]|nr:dicarboxylate/amino acid:cation symporter [Pseudomonadota bacterium]